MTRISLLLCSLFFSLSLFAQGLESELGFLYVKADYLLETNRYEEAIKEFNKIIEQDPAYKDALFKRASAKYAIAAFAGTKKDILLSFEVLGVDPEAVRLLGQAQKSLGENKAANTTLKTAAILFPEGNTTRTSPSKKLPEKTRVPRNEEPQQQDSTKTTGEKVKEELDKLDEKVNDIMDDILGKGKESGTEDDMPVEVPEEEVYVPDMSVNEIYVDEDLTIVIKDGLGGRRILEQPNILILSETSGEVTVDVCVDENGKVKSAFYNKDKSTLSIQSLVSLAVRKSKEFWFEGSEQKEICGSIIFKITGRN